MPVLHGNRRFIAWPPYRVLLRVGIAAAVLALAAALGLLPGLSQRFQSPAIMLAVMAASAVGLGALAWKRSERFEYGLLAVPLLAGLFNFLTLPTGTQSRLVLSLVAVLGLLGLWVLEWLVAHRRIVLRPLALNAPVLGFAAVSVIAYGWSNLLRDPLVPVWGSFRAVQIAALGVNVSLPLFALLVANKVRQAAWLQALTWLIIGLGAVAISALQFQLPTLRLIQNGSRGLFPMWAAALTYAQAVYNEKLGWGARALLLGLAGWFFFYYLGQHADWLSGWAPMLAACGLISARRSWKLLCLAGAAALIFFAFNFQTFYQNIYLANIESGGLQRLDLWRNNLELVARHPLFGVGPAGYAVYYMAYHAGEARSTHNNYFDVAAQAGVIGLAFFLWLFAVLIRLGHQTCRHLSGRRDFEAGFAAAAWAGCVGACAGMMLGDWVLPFAYNQTIAGVDNAVFTWLIAGGLVSLHQAVRPSAGPERRARAPRA